MPDRSLLRGRGVRVALAGLVVFTVAALALFLPYVAENREIVVGTPSPQPLFAFERIPLGPDQRACLAPVAVGPRAQLANMRFGTPGRESARVALTVTGPSYRHRTVATVNDDEPAFIEVRQPRRSLLGELCVRNLSAAPIELFGSTEPRTASRPVVRIDGRPIEEEVVLRFFARGSAGLPSRAGQIAESASAFKPWFYSEPVLWVLALVLVAGVPLATLGAFGWAVGRSDP